MVRHVMQRCDRPPEYGLPPAERDLADYVERGIVLLDKPAGTTSRRAAEAVQRIVGASKVGHGGTLDPNVTGVLPVLLGRSTKVARLLLGGEKTYEGIMQLHGDVPDDVLLEAMGRFEGAIEQLPPRRSRVKRRVRTRCVYHFRLTDRTGRRAGFSVRCQGGTYVRKLVHDLGQELGCGAHMASLRRTHQCCNSVADCSTLDEVRAAAAAAGEDGGAGLRRVVRPVEDLVGEILPVVLADDGALPSIATGYPLAVPGVCELDEFEPGDEVAVMTRKGELAAVGQALLGSGEVRTAGHGLAVAVSTVLIRPDDACK